jgi:hypothetical protein
MSVRAFSRAVALGAIVSLLATGVALADDVVAVADVVDPGDPVDLGQVAPGEVIAFDVGFSLECSGTKHVNSNQFVILTFSAIAPSGGDASGTDSIIAPPGGGWPADGLDCSTAPEPIEAAPSHVTITAPTTAGQDYPYLLAWSRVLNPAAPGDSGTFTTGTSVRVVLDVGGNTAPTVSVPNDMTVEGNTAGGATVTFTATASDAEDDPDPIASCTRSSGSFFALGTTTVTCDATDSDGLTGSASFSVTVVDTTAPSLTVPGDLSVETSNPSGAAVSYPAPSATDIVDPSPSATCLPASGITFAIGDTTVNCTATDHAGNDTRGSFNVHVSLVSEHTWSAIWDEPIGDGAQLSIGGGRTIPIKVQVFRDGVEVTAGSPVLTVTSCDGGSVIASTSLQWGGGNGRWSGHLDTSSIAGGCYQVRVMVGDATAGSFTLNIGGTTSPAVHKAANSRH